MPHSLRVAWFRYRIPQLLIVLICAAALLLKIPVAHADPHAMYYTTIGQQQLFFNVLAALDQADYVESKLLREELVTRRQQAGLPPETDQVITTTRSNLSGLLTRAITLEGDDLWTAYLANQFALEAARRTNTDEVIRIFCERGLGRQGCDDAINRTKKAEEDRKKAFVVNPVERKAQTVSSGVEGILDSSLDPGSFDQSQRQLLADPSSDKLKLPRPFDRSLATLKQQVADSEPKKSAVSRIITGVKKMYDPETIDSDVYDDLVIDESTGRVDVRSSASDSPEAYIDRYIGSLTGMMNLPTSVLATASRGADATTTFQQTTDQDGAVADTSLQAPVDPATKAITTVSGIVDTPAYAKAALTRSGIEAIPNTEQNLAYVPSDAESVAGQQQLVNRGAPISAAPAGQQASAGTSNPLALSTAGQVAGTSTDTAQDPLHHTNQTTQLSANTVPVGFHHEQGSQLLLKAIGFRADRGGCGCPGTKAANDHGRAILRKINGA